MTRRSLLWSWAFAVGLAALQAEQHDLHETGSPDTVGALSKPDGKGPARTGVGATTTQFSESNPVEGSPAAGLSKAENIPDSQASQQSLYGSPGAAILDDSCPRGQLRNKALRKLLAPVCSVDYSFYTSQSPAERHFADVELRDEWIGAPRTSEASPPTDLEPPSYSSVEAAESTETPSFLSFDEWRSRALAEQARQAEEAAQKRKASHARTESSIDEHGSAMTQATGDSATASHGTPTVGPKAVLEYIPSATDVGGALAIGHPAEGGHQRHNDTMEQAAPKAPPESSRDPSVLAQASMQMLKRLDGRVNYAKDDCAARILSSNPEAKHTSAILSEKKDRYMLNPCGAPSKYVIIELCGDLKVDTMVLANFEFFSSMVKNFKVGVGVATDGPWIDLGTFRAKNTRGLQIFQPSADVLNIFARYIRIDFLSHYGSEFYCPISLVRVYGLTEMEAWRREREEAELEVLEAATEAIEKHTATAKEASHLASELAGVAEESEIGSSTTSTIETVNTMPTVAPSTTGDAKQLHSASSANSSLEISKQQTALVDMSTIPGRVKELLSMLTVPIDTPVSETVRSRETVTAHAHNATEAPPLTSDHGKVPDANGKITSTNLTTAKVTSISTETPEIVASSVPPAAISNNDTETTLVPSVTGAASSSQTPSSSLSSKTVQMSNISSSAASSHANASMPRGAVTNIPGGTQESIYKTIMNRLTALEKNATLSLQYVEDQAKMFRDVLTRIEKRQEERMEHIVRGLNESASLQLLEVQARYEALLNEVMQGQSQRSGLTEKLEQLGREVVFGKRLGLTQFVVVLLPLLLVLDVMYRRQFYL